jgi:hypothetical protein
MEKSLNPVRVPIEDVRAGDLLADDRHPGLFGRKVLTSRVVPGRTPALIDVRLEASAGISARTGWTVTVLR